MTGDTTQVDLDPGTLNGLSDAVRRLDGIEGVGVVRLDKSDIVRHPLVQAIVDAYERGRAPVGRPAPRRAEPAVAEVGAEPPTTEPGSPRSTL